MATRPEDPPESHPDSMPPEPAGDPERIDPEPERPNEPVEQPHHAGIAGSAVAGVS